MNFWQDKRRITRLFISNSVFAKEEKNWHGMKLIFFTIGHLGGDFLTL